MTEIASPYTITRQNGQRDLEALKALLARDGVVDGDIDILQQIADSIEEQVKPAIEEPEEFGSVVRAGVDAISDRVLWVNSASGYWFSETSRRADFPDLYHPEVLRVGIGGTWLIEVATPPAEDDPIEAAIVEFTHAADSDKAEFWTTVQWRKHHDRFAARVLEVGRQQARDVALNQRLCADCRINLTAALRTGEPS